MIHLETEFVILLDYHREIVKTNLNLVNTFQINFEQLYVYIDKTKCIDMPEFTYFVLL